MNLIEYKNKTQDNKKNLFNKLKEKGVFWSYAKDIEFRDTNDNFLCEYTLKYGDYEDLLTIFSLYGEIQVKKVWNERLVDDLRFKKLNLLLARVFMKMDIESNYFTGRKNARFEKFKLLAS